MFDRFLRRRRRQQRLGQRRRIDEGREAQIESAGRAGGCAQVGNRFVEHREHLPHLARPVPVMRQGPFAQRPARRLGNTQAPGWIVRQRDVVERLRDLVRQHRVVVLGLRSNVMLGSRRRRVAIGPIPVDAIGGDRHEVKRRIRRHRRRHREDDAVGDARRLAVAD